MFAKRGCHSPDNYARDGLLLEAGSQHPRGRRAIRGADAVGAGSGIYDVSTGGYLGDTRMASQAVPWFNSSGQAILDVGGEFDTTSGWKTIEGGESCAAGPKLFGFVHLPAGARPGSRLMAIELQKRNGC